MSYEKLDRELGAAPRHGYAREDGVAPKCLSGKTRRTRTLTPARGASADWLPFEGSARPSQDAAFIYPCGFGTLSILIDH